MTVAARRRGACPALSAPMATGDGLLVRLHPPDRRLSARQLAAVAEAAARFGNGLVEVTARGHLQVRGLSASRLAGFREALGAAGLSDHDGPQVETPPLAGLAADEIRDPRPLAARLRAAIAPFAARLAPKVAVVVDGGGAGGLGDLLADVRLEATAAGWHVAIGGAAGTARSLGTGGEEDAFAAALAVLTRLAAAPCDGRAGRRGRDLGTADCAVQARSLAAEERGPVLPPAAPAGVFPLRDGRFALGLGLPFGRAGSEALCGLAARSGGAAGVLLAPRHGLVLPGLDAMQVDRLSVAAASLGFIVSPQDPRLRVTACAGAPFCDAALLQTHPLAGALCAPSRGGPALAEGRLHLSGCPKRCAAPRSAAVTEIVGTADGPHLAGRLPDAAAARRLLALSARHSVCQTPVADTPSHDAAFPSDL